MKNIILFFCLIVIIAMLLGVMVFVRQADNSALTRLAAQQEQILAWQKRVDQRINAASSLSDQRLKGLEDRLSIIDNKMKLIWKELERMEAAKKARPAPEDYKKVYDIPIGKSPIRGKANALVTIVGFLDLECPYSARFQPVINQVLEAYPGKVKYVIKHFPLAFHKQAKPAAKAMLAAGEQGKYWEMADAILKDSRGLSAEKLEGFAKTLKLNIKKYKAALKKKDFEWEKLIQEDYELGQKVGVRGTPTYYLNGRKTRSRNLESFKEEIDTILSQ